MKRPTWRPWSSGSPQNTGSFAPSAMSLEIGTEVSVSLCSGPPRPNRKTPVQIAIQLSMIVEITSWAPGDGLQQARDRPPGRASEAGRHHREQDVGQGGHRRERGADPDGEVGADEVLALAADVEEAAAEGEGDRQAGEDQRRRGEQRLLEVQLGDDPVVLADPREEPVEPGAVEDRLVGLDRVAAGGEHDEAADDEGEEDRDDRRDDPAAAQVGRQAARDGDGGVAVGLGAHAAASLRPPPVM